VDQEEFQLHRILPTPSRLSRTPIRPEKRNSTNNNNLRNLTGQSLPQAMVKEAFGQKK